MFCRFWISLLICIASSSALSQVVLTSNLPVGNVTSKSQLWNLTLLSMDPLPQSVTVELTFSNPNNGDRIFTATSRVIAITSQMTVLSFQAVQPVAINVLHSGYGVNADPDGFLPVGQFEVCYAVFKQTDEAPERVTELCDALEIEPLSPPMLISPDNGEVTDQVRPFFLWAPPAPIIQFNNLMYEFRLVEVSNGQSPIDAVIQNLPVYSSNNVLQSFLPYPSSQPDLDSAKRYAWQVAAVSASQAISKSEVFTFRVKLYGLDTLVHRGGVGYTPVARNILPSYITITTALRCYYLNEINDSKIVYNIRDLSVGSSEWMYAQGRELSVLHGDNYLSIDTQTIGGLVNNHFYEFRLTNGKGEHWTVKFQYLEPND